MVASGYTIGPIRGGLVTFVLFSREVVVLLEHLISSGGEMNWEMAERWGGWGAVLAVLWWMMHTYNAHLTKLIADMGAKLTEEVEAHKVIIATQNAMIQSLDRLVEKIDSLRGVRER